MATGTGPLAVNTSTMNTTDLTPSVNIESVGDDWGRIAASFERFSDVLKPTVKQQARLRGAEAGAAAARGERAYKSPALLNEINAEYEDAQRTAFMAGIRTDIDVREREIRGQHLYDPDGYRRATDSMVSGFVQGAPDVLAVDVESYGKTRVGNGMESVVAAASQRANQEAVATVTARQKSVEEDLLDLLAVPGGEDLPEYKQKRDEWLGLEAAKIANPLFAYTPEQSEIAEARLIENEQGSILTREATKAFREAGGGPAGYAAAKRLLSEALVDGRGPASRAEAAEGRGPGVPPVLADIPVARRQRLYRATSATLDAIYAGDRATAQAEAAAEREERAAERESADSWRLRIAMGEVGGEDEITRATDIDDGTKAGLLNSFRARRRSEASAARAEAAATRAASVATYSQYSDQARAGTLTNGEIADAVQAGFLTPGQAQTLRVSRDRGLKPVVADVLAPVRDEAKKPGRGIRGTAVAVAQAEELAAKWAVENPGATLDQRLAAGKAIAADIFKPPASGGGGPAAAQRGKSAQLRALDAERTRTRMNDAEYRRRRKQILDN